MSRKIFLFVLFSFSPFFLFATHNRAGEITYTKDPGTTLSYTVTVTTFTKESSSAADRDSLIVRYYHIASGTYKFDTVARVNGPDVAPPNGVPDGESLGNDIKMNIYISHHTFSGFGNYIISMQDLNRIGGICNIVNSVNQPFYVEDTLMIQDPQFVTFNNSPVLTNYPMDFGVANSVYVHNPNAYDPDGDSLHFEFTIPKVNELTDVSGYTQPNTTSESLTINPSTGEIIWDKPGTCCVYNIAILITEYRLVQGQGYIKVGTMVRDMEIIIDCKPNLPPVIADVHDTCIVAGALLTLKVRSTDPNPGQQITLEANGGPFVANPPDTAQFILDPDTMGYGTFVWQTVCNHARHQFYEVVFKATDDYETLPLADLETWLIHVAAPAPENLTATPQGNSIIVNWNNPYVCAGAKKFLGFSLWRREGSNPFVNDTCNPTMIGKGYTKILSEYNAYTYTDLNVERGKEYCYRVEAEFADTTFIGIYNNFFESLASNEDCASLKLDVPVITHASVRNTDLVNGSIYVGWAKPSGTDLDTVQNPGPYQYKIYHSPDFNGNNLQLIHTVTAAGFSALTDTFYIDTLINTVDNPWSYKVSFFSNGDSIGETEIASSIFLVATGADNKVNLTWSENVPWTNEFYSIYRKNKITLLWDSIGVSVTQSYSDKNLFNDSTYCYYVKSTGGYSSPGIIYPIINFSQRTCAVPIDTVGPCPPVITVTNDCSNPDFSFGSFTNLIQWNLQTSECAVDLLHYNLYYSPIEGEDLKLIDSSISNISTSFIHHLENSVAGCYAVSGVDSNYNEGPKSAIVCIENCPYYELPNVFTPNGDDHNDVFHPFLPYKYIAKIDIKIFDSWGVEVFETTDPNIGWDGKNIQNGKMCPDGTYYYVCDVYEQTLQGTVKWKKPLSGFIHLYK